MDNEMAMMPTLVEFMKTNKFIYTVRRFDYKVKHVVVDGAGKCIRTKITHITNKFDLEPYTKDSGFASTEQWWKTIRTFTRPGDPLILWKVEVSE